ncbi:MAG: peptidylprolyl isomerase [Oscillospiraceae bacterium]|nr:peptidylprolyl isomerase [Oscillospiraceae bacterium]
MKKLITIMLVIFIAFGAFMTWNHLRGESGAPEDVFVPAEGEIVTETPAEAPAEDAAPAEPIVVRHVDYDAIRALHGEDETVLTMAGETARWKEYFDLLRSTGLDIESYFEQMGAYYGVAADWEGSVGDGTGQTFAQYAVSEAREYLESILTVRAFARENGVELDQEELKSLEPEQVSQAFLSEGQTLEDFYRILEDEAHMSFDTYRDMREASLLYGKTVEKLYGAGGEKLPEEDAVAWLEEQGFLAAHHILLMTIDPNTGAALEESEIQAKREKAGEIAAQLQAIEDQEELLKRFVELKDENCEDTGKTVYPDGYTFQPGTMVQGFEDAVKSLAEYAVSDPVETAYGYHVIMRLPLRGDAPLTTLTGAATTAREELVSKQITEALDAFQSAHPAEYADGIEDFDLLPYVK